MSSSTKKNILVAEDEETNYLFIEAVLESGSEDYVIYHAKNGEQAVNMCNQNSMHIVLLDLKMPILDGFEAARIIKKQHPQIPIIAQTAYSTDEDRQKAIDAGCTDFISKPIENKKLIALIRTHIL